MCFLKCTLVDGLFKVELVGGSLFENFRNPMVKVLLDGRGSSFQGFSLNPFFMFKMLAKKSLLALKLIFSKPSRASAPNKLPVPSV